jgi:hypothetical protein
MTNLLKNNTFPHDLDPMFVSGTASAGGGAVTITLNSDSSSTPGIFGLTSGVGLQDVNSWKISYTGAAGTRLTDLSFNPTGGAATAGNTTGGNNGLDQTLNYFSNVYPGAVFLPAVKAFTTGTFTGGLVGADVAAPTFANLAPAPSNGTNQWWTMNMTFPTSNFTNGRAFTFTVGRGQQHTSAVGTFAAPQGGAPFAGPNSGGTTSDPSADILGGANLIPEQTTLVAGVGQGMAFSGHIFDGANSVAFNGTMNNTVGFGYSVLDGFGFINMEAAATGSLTIPPAVASPTVVSRKTHGGAGTFDIPIAGTECRDGGATGSYTLVFTFANTISRFGGAVVADGIGNVSSTSLAGNAVTVNLTNVTNAQRVTVSLVDVHDSAGNVSASMPAVLRVLIGDTSNNGSVTGTDVSQTKGQSGAPVTIANFREDVVVNGAISGTDVSSVKGHTGTAVP